MRVLFDSDVLLDVGLKRMPWFDASAASLRLAQRHAVAGFVAWHSIANVHYLTRGQDAPDAKGFIGKLVRILEVAPVGHEDMEFALHLPMPDLEDAMQAAAAVVCRADRIVTRNKKDFAKSPVRAISPDELLQEIGAAS